MSLKLAGRFSSFPFSSSSSEEMSISCGSCVGGDRTTADGMLLLFGAGGCVVG